MTREKYLKRIETAYETGEISRNVYETMIRFINELFDDEEDVELPEEYAEVEYDDFEDPEAILGARFDDANFTRYLER